MIRKLLLIAIAFSTIQSWGADKKYPVSEIPEELKKGMYAVIRERTVKITIENVNRYTYYTKTVITILNKKAERFSYESVDYDKLSKVTQFKGVAYDAEGNVIQKLKQADIQDRSYVANYSLFEDTRIKSASLEQTTYPYTVEFETELQNNFLYDLPDFDVYDDDEVTTEKAVFIVEYNKEFPPRFKTFKVGDPAKSMANGLETLKWTFEKIIPEKFEPYSSPNKKVPYIMISPSVFEYSGFRGDMSTWESFAKWKTDLLKGRDELPEATKQKMQDLTKGLTFEEKIRTVYEYVQSKTRYVNISLGIGGLQPIPAKVVDEVGYGDCKGLSNYTIALLNSVGIKSLYTTIRAGEDEEEVIEDFPSHQSNHVIVAVPNKTDTIWLECTSQTKSAGFMGSFTNGRKALINTPTGGKLVKTPDYNWDQNKKTTKATVTIESSGDASAIIKSNYAGLQSENSGLDEVVYMSNEKQKEWIQNTTSIPNFNINNFSLKAVKGKIPVNQLTVDLSIRKFATVNGKRFFVTPGLFNRPGSVPAKTEKRKTEIYMGSGFVNMDTIEYTIPETIYSEFIPEPVTITSRFGEYEAKCTVEQNKLIYIRRIKITGGTHPPESYSELIDFLKNVSKADNTKVVFMTKT